MLLLNKLLRLLLILLLLLNGIYYVWQHYFSNTKVVNVEVFNLPSIKLLSEVSEPLIEIKTAIKNPHNCWFLGEISNQNEAKNLEQRLLSFDIAAQIIHKNSDNLNIDYLVYLPPNPTPEAAQQQIAELKIKQLEGYIINYDDLNNTVALGVFPNRGAAENMLESLRLAGYVPRLREQNRMSNNFWLQIASNRSHLLDDNTFAKLAADFPHLNKVIMPCE